MFFGGSGVYGHPSVLKLFPEETILYSPNYFHFFINISLDHICVGLFLGSLFCQYIPFGQYYAVLINTNWFMCLSAPNHTLITVDIIGVMKSGRLIYSTLFFFLKLLLVILVSLHFI